MRQREIADAILTRAQAGLPVLGICGGCQMLGQTIEDPERIESDTAREPGLGLLPLRTRFGHDKLTAQVTARMAADSLLAASGATGALSGYEIHMGIVELVPASMSSSASLSPPYPFVITSRNSVPCQVSDGAVAGSIVGTMIHGILNNDAVRAALLCRLRQRRALLAPAVATDGVRANKYDRLATIVRDALFATPHATNGPLSEMFASLFCVA